MVRGVPECRRRAAAARIPPATPRAGAVWRRGGAAHSTRPARARRLAQLELRSQPRPPPAQRPGGRTARGPLPQERIVKSTARLEWFLGSALILLAAQLGFGAWHGRALPTWTPPREWDTVGPLAVSPGGSTILEERSSRPLLAEFEYRLRVLHREGREGD